MLFTKADLIRLSIGALMVSLVVTSLPTQRKHVELTHSQIVNMFGGK